MSIGEFFLLLSVIIWGRFLTKKEAMFWASLFALLAFVLWGKY